MANFKYINDEDKPRDNAVGLSMQIDGTKQDINKLKRKLNKSGLTVVEKSNIENTLNYYQQLLSIYENELSKDKQKKQEDYINKDNFTWNDNMEADKPLYINAKKEQILNGSTFYRDKYISDTWAFLAPDNFGADTVDEIEVDIDTQLAQAGKEFDEICNDVKNYFVWACQETNQLDLIDKTTNWRLRDFISESWYQSEQYDSTTNHRQFAMWRNVVMKGKQGLTDDMLCVTEHMSKFDKLN